MKHLLVDLDGTLLGSRDLPLTVEFIFRMLRALRQHGNQQGGQLREWYRALRTLAELRDEVTRTPEEIIQGMTNDKRAIQVVSESLSIPEEEAHDFLISTVQDFFPKLERHFYPIPQAKDFLDWAKSHFTLTLATNPIWPEEIIKLRVRWAGIDPDIFSFFSHNGVMHACKPSRHYYEELLQIRGFHPNDCLLIGNDMKMDLPATASGIAVFILDRNSKAQRIKMRNHPHSSAAPAWRGSFDALKKFLQLHLKKGAEFSPIR